MNFGEADRSTGPERSARTPLTTASLTANSPPSAGLLDVGRLRFRKMPALRRGLCRQSRGGTNATGRQGLTRCQRLGSERNSPASEPGFVHGETITGIFFHCAQASAGGDHATTPARSAMTPRAAPSRRRGGLLVHDGEGRGGDAYDRTAPPRCNDFLSAPEQPTGTSLQAHRPLRTPV